MSNAEWSEAMVEKFQVLSGSKLLGVVDGLGCVEFVFDRAAKGEANLLTVWPDTIRHGPALGFVADPKGYASGDWHPE